MDEVGGVLELPVLPEVVGDGEEALDAPVAGASDGLEDVDGDVVSVAVVGVVDVAAELVVVGADVVVSGAAVDDVDGCGVVGDVGLPAG